MEPFSRGRTLSLHDFSPSLSLADVHGVLSYYLRHRPEIEEYLHERQRQAEEAQRRNEARFDPQGLREKLLARKHDG